MIKGEFRPVLLFFPRMLEILSAKWKIQGKLWFIEPLKHLFLQSENKSFSSKYRKEKQVLNAILSKKIQPCVGNIASPKEIIQRFIRIKIYYIFTLLKMHFSLSNFPCYKFFPNAVSLNCDPCEYISGYFLRCLTKRGRNFFTKEINLPIWT